MSSFKPAWEPLEEVRRPEPPRRAPERPSVGRAIARGLGWGMFGLLFGLLLALAGAIVAYAYYAVQLPSPQELRQRATAFKSTKIYDRNGRLLFEVFDPLGGRRTLVRRQEMPDILVAAVISTEDATFYTNPGWNPFSIVRALYANLKEGEVVQGGSTITQQLVKNLYLSQERTLARKVQEAILATEITRRYTKDEILELYLNEVYFGNLAYGIEAASETYFAKPVSQLTLPEAALLAGLIQSPALYDPYTAPEAARDRREVVLGLLRARGIITQEEFMQANQAPLGVVSRRIQMEAPHMVMYVRELLEREYGTEVLYKGGLQVYTTLDLEMQHLAEEIVRQKVEELAQYKASNASLVAMDPSTGEILAMVGSVDFWKEGYGQVNVALRLRQPGSTLKPFTYLAAFERGWSPSTMVMDVSQTFPDGANPPYKPRNYDGKEYGPISVRTALACSRNIPAVATLYQIGLPALLEICQRVGISSLNRPDYGLSLTLGGGDVTLLELTAAYAAFANGGYRVPPRAILYIEDQEGRVIRPQSAPTPMRVMDPRHAYFITHILADPEARKRAFGANNPLD
ncbi:MAG: transglycosylase domain-containing protein, partial [Chloroflexi bacterium]|nr:transglycosylase domain-containing protein [Chloroflexota bacterium]